LNFDHTGRFRVLKDTVIHSSPMAGNNEGGTTDAVINHYPFDEFVSLRGIQTTYSGTSNPQTIADISSGALYLVVRAATNTATTNFWSYVSGVARLRYYG